MQIALNFELQIHVTSKPKGAYPTVSLDALEVSIMCFMEEDDKNPCPVAGCILTLIVCVCVTFLGIIPGARRRMASNTHLFTSGHDLSHSWEGPCFTGGHQEVHCKAHDTWHNG